MYFVTNSYLKWALVFARGHSGRLLPLGGSSSRSRFAA